MENEQERARKAALFREYVTMDEARRAEIIDTGAFNGILEAYLVGVMEQMGADRAKILEAAGILRAQLEAYNATEEKERAAAILNREA